MEKKPCHGSRVTLIALSLSRELIVFVQCANNVYSILLRIFNKDHLCEVGTLMALRWSSGATRLPVADHIQRFFAVFAVGRGGSRGEDAPFEELSKGELCKGVFERNTALCHLGRSIPKEGGSGRYCLCVSVLRGNCVAAIRDSYGVKD